MSAQEVEHALAGTPRVLVVEDDARRREVIAKALASQGFSIEAAADGKSVERAIADFEPDLVVLDVALSDTEAFDIARRLTSSDPRTPVIFVSGDPASDAVAALAVGDDYLTERVGLAETVARVRAVLRRTHVRDASVLRFADLVLDERAREVWRRGELVDLTRTEFELLRFFMRNPRRVLTKHQILQNVWGDDFRGGATVVETYISYLRKKLDGGGPSLIRTGRLVGYALPEP